MKKRLLALMLSSLLAVGLVSGCSSDSSADETEEAAETAEEETDETQEDASEEEEAAETAEETVEADETEEAAEEADAELIELNVAYMANYASLWVFVTADNLGYFAEEGLSITLYEFADGPTEIASMESGSIDIAYIGPGAHSLAIQGNVDVFCYSQIGNADSVIGLASHGVETIEDLEGKTVGYASGTTSETILTRALNSVGLTLDDVEAYDMDITNMVSALVSGSLDAGALWSPSTGVVLEELGEDAIELCNNETFADEAADVASFICTPSYAEENRDILLAFTRAIYKAMDYASQEENYEEVAGYVAAQCGTDLDTALDQTGDGKWLDSATLKEYLEDGTIESYYEIQKANFVSSGKITEEEGSVAVTDYVLIDLMLEAFED